MIPPFIRRPSVIQRYSVPMTQRYNTTVENPDDPFGDNNKGYLFKKLVCKNVTIQPLSSYQMSLLPSGVSSKECYTLFSENVMFSAIDNTNRLSDSIYLPSCLINRNASQVESSGYVGGWFTVVKTKNWFTGVIPHSESVIVRDTDLMMGGEYQYPQKDIEALLPNIETIQQLRGNKWWQLWEVDNAPGV